MTKNAGPKKRKHVVAKALETLGVALADHGHTWTKEERRLFERAHAQASRL